MFNNHGLSQNSTGLFSKNINNPNNLNPQINSFNTNNNRSAMTTSSLFGNTSSGTIVGSNMNNPGIFSTNTMTMGNNVGGNTLGMNTIGNNTLGMNTMGNNTNR